MLVAGDLGVSLLQATGWQHFDVRDDGFPYINVCFCCYLAPESPKTWGWHEVWWWCEMGFELFFFRSFEGDDPNPWADFSIGLEWTTTYCSCVFTAPEVPFLLCSSWREYMDRNHQLAVAQKQKLNCFKTNVCTWHPIISLIWVSQFQCLVQNHFGFFVGMTFAYTSRLARMQVTLNIAFQFVQGKIIDASSFIIIYIYI